MGIDVVVTDGILNILFLPLSFFFLKKYIYCITFFFMVFAWISQILFAVFFHVFVENIV